MTPVPEAMAIEPQREALLAPWELGKIHAAVELAGGMFLKPLRLFTDLGSYVLREHTFRPTRDSFQFQYDLVNGCANAGVSCARILPTRVQGIGIVHGEAFVALHEYVEGSVHDWTSWHRLKHEQSDFLPRLGASVARLHNAAFLLKPQGDPRLPITLPPLRFDDLTAQREDFEQRIAAVINRSTPNSAATREAFLANLPHMRRHWDRLADWAIETRVAHLPQQPIHGDISAVNTVFDDRGIPSFIDWDACQIGWRLYDAIGDVLNRPPHEFPAWNLFSQGEIEAYLAGYREVANPAVQEHELHAVPLYCLARQMEDLRQRLFTINDVRGDCDEVNALLIRRRVEMMEQIHPFVIR